MRMVDLAGSERFEKSEVGGIQQCEAIATNY